jgi:hypothetical protein
MIKEIAEIAELSNKDESVVGKGRIAGKSMMEGISCEFEVSLARY